MKSLAQRCYDFASFLLGALTLACVGAFVLQCGELSSLRVYSFVHNLILPTLLSDKKT